MSAHPAGVYVLVAGLLFQGLSGVVGGIALVVDPSGGLVHIPVSWLEGSPFNDYLLPGLVLLLGLGVFPLATAYAFWRRARWAQPAALLVGVALIAWIAVEILVIGYHPEPPLQAFYGALGIAITILALLPSVRRYS